MSVKDINIKNHTYYFFDDITNIKDFDTNNIKTDKDLYQNILFYYIGYFTIKKQLKIHSVSLLYFIFGDVNGYFKGIIRNKYLTLVPTNESKEKLKKYEELWIKIRDLIRSITKRSITKNLDDYDEKYIKVKIDSDNELPLNKTIEIPIMTIVVRAFFNENNIYYPHVF